LTLFNSSELSVIFASDSQSFDYTKLADPVTPTTRQQQRRRFYPMSFYRTYIDPQTAEALFYSWDFNLGGWAPDITSMTAWRTGTLRAYRPTATLFITMPGYVSRPVMTDSELQDICGIATRPWIPDGAVPLIAESDICRYDAWNRTELAPTVWEDADRPLLHYDDPLTVTVFQSINQEMAAAALLAINQTQVPEPSAPTQTPTPSHQQQSELPRHVALMVLQNAVAAGATCPISMEPIGLTGSSVTGCGHVFQTAALRRWTHSTCPECRTQTTATAF
jgi:hypothetical protein